MKTLHISISINPLVNVFLNYLQELLNTAICAVLYCIAFIVQIAVWSPYYRNYRGTNLAAGVSIQNNALFHEE